MSADISETDAIRQVIREGASGDYCDIAEIVRKRFRLHVGTGLVEQVAAAMKKEPSEASLAKVTQIDIGLSENVRGTLASDAAAAKSAAASGPPIQVATNRVLEFVEAMGGFDAARNAITDLENSLRKLMR